MPQWALVLMQVLSMLPSVIQSIEEAFGERPGEGARKKEAVLGTVNAAMVVASEAGVEELARPEVRQAVVSVAGSLTDALVAGFNAADAWRRSATPEPGRDGA